MSRVHRKTLHNPLLIAGRQVRTSNAAEGSGSGKIAGLWQSFLEENIGAAIPNRVGETLYAVYSNYDSDENGAYDLLLGVEVSTIEGLPGGITFAAVPTGEYAVLTTNKGPVADVVSGTWREIWSMGPDELGGPRAYLADYEVYDARAMEPTDAVVEIHVGVESRAS